MRTTTCNYHRLRINLLRACMNTSASLRADRPPTYSNTIINCRSTQQKQKLFHVATSAQTIINTITSPTTITVS